jgi:multiple sugar transport system permease protein
VAEFSDTFSIIPFARYYGKHLVPGDAEHRRGGPLSNTMIAFSLARLRFRGRKLMFSLSIGTLMIPASVTMIPTFIEWNWFAGVNTHLPLFVPALFRKCVLHLHAGAVFPDHSVRVRRSGAVDGAS